MKKWVKRLVVLAVVLLVVLVLAVWLGGNQAARKGIEVGGKAALGVDTQVKAVHIGFLSSSVGLQGFQIGNPEGYKTDRLMALGSGKVACDVASLLGDEVVVREILLDQPELTIELKPGLPPKSNLGDLLKKLESDKQAPKEEAKPASAKTFRVDLIRITKAKVRFHLLAGKTANVVLPDIELKEVKNADGTPLMLGDIFAQVLASMATSSFKSAKGVVSDDLLGGLGDSLASAQKLLGDSAKALGEGVQKLQEGAGALTKEIGKGAGAVTKELGKGAEGLKEGAGKVTKGVGGALKGILGKKKDDKTEKKDE